MAAKVTTPAAPTAGMAWVEHVQATLAAAGHRASAPRTAVVEVLARHGCVLTARDVVSELRGGGREVGTATVYRALELLEELGLIQRLEVGEGTARFEPVHPSGDHHHHFVCDTCGQVSPFEDTGVERAIARLARRMDHQVGGHDIILRGDCPACVR